MDNNDFVQLIKVTGGLKDLANKVSPKEVEDDHLKDLWEDYIDIVDEMDDLGRDIETYLGVKND